MVAVAVVPVGSDHPSGAPPHAHPHPHHLQIRKPVDLAVVRAERMAVHVRTWADYQASDEVFLLIRARQGDKMAGEVLFERYSRTIYDFLRARVNSDQDAEDLAQDTMVNAWRALGDLGHDEFRRWIFTIALNLYRSWCRRLYARFPTFSMERAHEDHGFEIEDVAAESRMHEVARADPFVTEALRALTPYQQRVVIDHFMCGYTFRELAIREVDWRTTPVAVFRKRSDDPAVERRAEALKQVGQRGRAAFVKRYFELTGIDLLSIYRRSPAEASNDEDPEV